MSNLYYIHEEFGSDSTAATKAPNDLQKIFQDCKFKPLVTLKKNSKIVRIFDYAFKLLLCLIRIRSNDIVIFQFPFATHGKLKNFLMKLLQYKKAKMIFLMNDLESLRYSGNKKNLISKEQYIKNADVIICHNQRMKEFLIENKIDSEKIVVLGVFDYLLDKFNKEKASFDKTVVIAGNLSPQKSGYLTELLKNENRIKFNLYGPNFTSSTNNNDYVSYKGSFSPEKIPFILEGDFGLVWDGNSILTCSGITGEYLKYNNPHKVSLFIASKIPVIVWKQSALSNFVKENNIGIVVNDLIEMQEIITNMTEEQYEIFRENIEQLSKKVRQGYFTNLAIEKSLSIIKNNLNNYFEED